MCDEECSLVERLAQLDDSAWEEFCRKYSGPLLAGMRLRFGVSQELAEEIVHMTFIRCVKSIKTFDPARGGLFGWLNAIARNEAHTLLRKASPPGPEKVSTSKPSRRRRSARSAASAAFQ